MSRLLGDPNLKFLNLLTGHDKRLRALERGQVASLTFDGPRNDDPRQDGSLIGPRVRVGLLSDDTYGVERWGLDGARQTPTWA